MKYSLIFQVLKDINKNKFSEKTGVFEYQESVYPTNGARSSSLSAILPDPR